MKFIIILKLILLGSADLNSVSLNSLRNTSATTTEKNELDRADVMPGAYSLLMNG